MTDEMIKIIKLQNNFAKNYWDVTIQKVEEINRNTEMITELNKKFTNYYQHLLKNDQN